MATLKFFYVLSNWLMIKCFTLKQPSMIIDFFFFFCAEVVKQDT